MGRVKRLPLCLGWTATTTPSHSAMTKKSAQAVVLFGGAGVSVRRPSTELVGPGQKGWQSPIDPQLRQAVGQNPF